MRINNSIRNTTFGFINYFGRVITQFLVRTIFIYTLGAEYLGLNGLFSNILMMLSLAELGIGSAIVFNLYKPIAENDEEKIKSLLGYYKKAYFIIGFVVLIAGLILLPFLPHLIKDSDKIQFNIYTLFLITLSNTIVGYFFAHKRTILFANQRSDIEKVIALIFDVLLCAAQIILLVIFKSYLLYILIVPFFTFFDLIIIAVVANRRYPFIKEKALKLEKSETQIIFKNTSALLFHKIGGVIVFGTDNLIISVVFGLVVLGYYSNYILVTTTIATVIGLLTNAINSSAGDMIAKESKLNVLKTFNALNFLLFWILGVCLIALIILIQPFIALWIGNIYKLDNFTTLLLLISFYLTQSRKMTEVFKAAAGLFLQNKFMPIYESVINLGASILLMLWIGLPGVVLGTILSTVFAPLWVEPFVLYKHYFKRSVLPYFGKYLIYTSVTIVVGGFTFFLCWLLPAEGVWAFVGKMAICAVVPNLIFLLCYFKTESFKYWVSLIRTLIKKKTKT